MFQIIGALTCEPLNSVNKSITSELLDYQQEWMESMSALGHYKTSLQSQSDSRRWHWRFRGFKSFKNPYRVINPGLLLTICNVSPATQKMTQSELMFINSKE